MRILGDFFLFWSRSQREKLEVLGGSGNLRFKGRRGKKFGVFRVKNMDFRVEHWGFLEGFLKGVFGEIPGWGSWSC